MADTENDNDSRRSITKDRLIELLNLDLNCEKDALRYCNKFNLIIFPVNCSFSDKIKEVLFPLKAIVDYYLANGDLLPEHIIEINNKLKGITFQLSKIEAKDVRSVNYKLDPSLESYDYQVESVKNPQFGFTSKHADSIISLWESFAKYVVRRQKIGNCANCGKYFIQKTKSHGQIYCSPACEDRYKKKRRYYKRK